MLPFRLITVGFPRWPLLLLTMFTLLLLGAQRPPQEQPHIAAAPNASLSASAMPGVRFVHTSTDANRFSNSTRIDHPLLNNNPNAIFFVTQNWNPGGSAGLHHNHPIGVWYTGTQWAIFNEDLAIMPAGADFNVFIPDSSLGAFVHSATASNIGCGLSQCTYIDHPSLNNNPNAVFFVTQNWNPGDTTGIYNPHYIGVWYDDAVEKWAIFNQNKDTMPDGADFNVVIADTSTAFVHSATASNIGCGSNQCTYIDHPAFNNNPNAVFFVTQNWNPGDTTGTYNDHAIGVWYDAALKKWAIFNQDLAAMPEGADFNILLPETKTSVFTHVATASTISCFSDHCTFIDHPLLNDNPNALFFVTPTWTANGADTFAYNDHPIGVYYSTSLKQWAIFNQDTESLSESAAFNVLIPPPGANVFVHTTTSANITSNSTYIDHPLLNNNPNAVVLVTPNWNPGGIGDQYHNHHVGIWYDDGPKQWAIFNEDQLTMAEGISFNVLVLNDLTSLPGANDAFTHTSAADTVANNWTNLDHPLTNKNPVAFVFTTLNWNPGGAATGKYHNHAVGVWYNSDITKQNWTIFNQDQSGMPTGVGFNVLVITLQSYLPLVIR